MEDTFVFPGERIVAISSPVPIGGAKIAPRDALAMLCGSTDWHQISYSRPPNASTHRPEHSDATDLQNFEVLFARDALITARFVFDEFPELTTLTVRALAKLQGRRWDALSEEEPGRIPHEVRHPDDPIAVRISESNGWRWPYYGAIDTTPMFIGAIASLWRSGRDVVEWSAAIGSAAQWLLRRLTDGHGLLVSQPANPKGIENQVWKDSWDAFSFADGHIARPPIASVDVQAAAYDACLDAADLLTHMHEFRTVAEQLRHAAGVLQQLVVEAFWTSDEGGTFPAIALQWAGSRGAWRQLSVRASNMGHLLYSRLLDARDFADRRDDIALALSSPSLLCGAGIRTLAASEQRYRPFAYHNGTSWPWDTTIAALGLARHGYTALRI
ncbi:MAG: hypothetical protein DLM58_17245 [Pseudonocardiales bacterium]|nr:MAG: hypothetical protein DLM58_17245 [Pseudonocardiales bacterium]